MKRLSSRFNLLFRSAACRRSAVALGFSLVLGAVAHAAVPQAWWVDIANDRSSNVSRDLKKGVDPNLRNAEELPSLMLAIRSGAWKVYDALLADRRTDINVQNKYGETPLMYLALLGETQRAEALIKRGAKVNRMGWTPLHYAASKGQTETAQMLLRHGAIVNAPAPDGTLPIMMAAYSGDRDTVQLLLNQGADPSAINLNKKTAADWARERKHTRLADELAALAERITAEREGRVAPQPAPAAAPQTSAPEAKRSSPYFDLERFEREDGDR